MVKNLSYKTFCRVIEIRVIFKDVDFNIRFFFHQTTSARKKANTISHFQNNNGDWVSSQGGLKMS